MSTQAKLFPGIKRLTEVTFTHGKGSRLFAKNGPKNGYLDMTSGIGVCSTGHSHPTVVAAVQKQAAKVVHAQMSVGYHEPMLELIECTQPYLPKSLNSFFFTNSGSEAIEGAVRLARQATGKDTIIAFQGGYHGRTTGTLALTTSSAGYRGNRVGPMPAGTVFAPYPYEHLGPHRSSDRVFEELDLLFKMQTSASETAAVLIEPFLGEGGYVPAPIPFMKKLRKWCDQHNLLLIADEVQSGYARTGKMFAYEHSEIAPDILVVAKGIASGYPLSGVISRADLTAKQPKGCMGGTYGGNAVACAAAVATLEVFEKEGLMANASARGAQLKAGLQKIAKESNGLVKDVRGWGLMVGMEFDHTRVGAAASVSAACLERNMLLMVTGVRETVRFVPPLVITESEINECLEVVSQAVQHTNKTVPVKKA